jgi:hypothetical protein
MLPQQIAPQQAQQAQMRFNNRGTGARYQAALEIQRQERATVMLMTEQRHVIVWQGGDEFDFINEEEVENMNRLISRGYKKDTGAQLVIVRIQKWSVNTNVLPASDMFMWFA